MPQKMKFLILKTNLCSKKHRNKENKVMMKKNRKNLSLINTKENL